MPGGASGSILTSVDAKRAYPADMETNGTRISAAETDTGTPRITLANGETQRLKWLVTLTEGWDAITLGWLAVNESAAAGAVKWQFAYKLMYLGEGNVDGPVTTVTIPAQGTGGQFDTQLVFPPATEKLAVASGFFGDKPFLLCSLSRLGGHGDDTLDGDVSVAAVFVRRDDL